MRILGGILGGMQVISPKGDATRPTLAKVREATLSAVAESIVGASILDLYAGSGSFTLDAISRGASSAVLVEQAPEACRAIDTNLQEARRRFRAQSLEFPSVKVIGSSVQKSLAELGTLGKFDIVWADPPYSMVVDQLELLAFTLGPMMTKNGQFIIESDAKLATGMQAFTERHKQWSVVKQRTYGNTTIHRLKYDQGSNHESV